MKTFLTLALLSVFLALPDQASACHPAAVGFGLPVQTSYGFAAPQFLVPTAISYGFPVAPLNYGGSFGTVDPFFGLSGFRGLRTVDPFLRFRSVDPFFSLRAGRVRVRVGF